MTEPNFRDAPDLISVGAQAIAQDPRRLGLVWGLRLATIVTENPLTATYDGDTAPINVIPMVGGLGTGDRVYVMFVPPAGNYVVGVVPTSSSRMWADVVTVDQAGYTSIDITVPDELMSLDVDMTLRSTGTGFRAAAASLTVNGAVTASYSSRYMQAAGATASAVTHVQTWAATSAYVGIYPTSTAPAGGFGNGRLTFPAWNAPHASNLGFLFTSSFEMGVGDGWYNSGGGVCSLTGPFTTFSISPAAGFEWDIGSQVHVRGWFTP